MYVYIHIYIHTCIYVHIFIYICIYLYVYIYVCMIVCVHIRIISVYTYKCRTCPRFISTTGEFPAVVYVYIYAYSYTYIYVCIYIYIRINTYTDIYVCKLYMGGTCHRCSSTRGEFAAVVHNNFSYVPGVELE